MAHPIRIVVHSGSFHADDVFAVAALLRLYPGAEVVRTRDPEIIRHASIVADVGGEYDPDRDRFDHHQKGGAGARANGVPYASIGLVWKKYGETIAGGREAADLIDVRLIAPIDGPDNGVALHESSADAIAPYDPGALVQSFNPTWREGAHAADQHFREAVEVASKILEREIIAAQAAVEAAARIHAAYAAAADKRVIVLDERYPWHDLARSLPETMFVVTPEEAGKWKVKAVWADESFKNRLDLPLGWAGLHDRELAEASGVPDALFCHNKRFIAVAGSKEGAIALAQKAIEAAGSPA